MDLNFADKRATDLFASRNSVYAVTHRDKDFNFARVYSRSFRPNQELLYHRQDTQLTPLYRVGLVVVDLGLVDTDFGYSTNCPNLLGQLEV